MIKPALRVLDRAEQISRAAAGEFVRAGQAAIAARGRFTVALAGGSTPRRLYELLADPAFRGQLDWSRVEFFWGDERAVPPDHPDSNYRMAREALLDKLAISPARIHRMPAERPDRDAAAGEYQAEIARVCGAPAEGPPPVLDLVLLGMGADGHTASLFPYTAALHEMTRWVVANHVPQLQTDRLTLTRPILNAASQVLFLVAGADKAAVLAEVLAGRPDPDRLPAQFIQPHSGALTWLLDRSAAARLSATECCRIEVTHHPESIQLAPSILAADFARLGEQVREAEQAGADRIHVDVMDGHFVPNISIGPLVVKSLRKVTKLPLETHLMISDPDRYLEAFAEAGSDSLLVHQEDAPNLHRTLQRIRDLGKQAGVVINPATPASVLEEVLGDVDLVLVMTVNPGFGGQAFIPSMLPKIRRIRGLIDQLHPECELEVDGGIDAATVPLAVEAGARVLVAGSAVFGAAEGVAAAMQRLRASAGSRRS